MPEEKKTVELKEEDLEKVSGGGFIVANEISNGWFDTNDIVEDNLGVRYQILGWDSIDREGSPFETKWFNALVIYVLESAMCNTSWRENEVHTVNSSFVHKV